MGLFSWLKKRGDITKKYIRLESQNLYDPIFSQYGQNIYAYDVVQQALNCIVREVKKLRFHHMGRGDNGQTIVLKDIVQNVFLRLLRSDKMITTITLPCLVYTIARNLIFDYWRHHQSVEEYEHFFVRQSSSEMDVASIYSATEINEILERGIARLTDNQRVIYRMNIYEGKKVSEISETLHLSYKSVENRLGSARKEIRQYVKRMLA